MNAQQLSRRLSARKIVAQRLATNLIVHCERAASGRNGKRADPAFWNKTDWRHYLHIACRSPASSRLPALYRDIGEIENTLHEADNNCTLDKEISAMTTTAHSPETIRIRELNDAFRRAPSKHGQLVWTSGISILPFDEQLAIIAKVKGFDDFSPDNDPHGEHDFGSFDFKDEKIFWKIDYYDQNIEYGSEDPADPSQTTRVLTVMLARES